MPSANVENLVSIATNLIKKKLAIKASSPSLFETLQNIDDQFRAASNAIVASGEEGQLTADQIYLINSAATGVPRTRLIELEKTYTSDDTDVVGELRDVKQINFNELSKIKEGNPELYDQMVKAGIVAEQ
jgi:hypothetical protein